MHKLNVVSKTGSKNCALLHVWYTKAMSVVKVQSMQKNKDKYFSQKKYL